MRPSEDDVLLVGVSVASSAAVGESIVRSVESDGLGAVDVDEDSDVFGKAERVYASIGGRCSFTYVSSFDPFDRLRAGNLRMMFGVSDRLDGRSIVVMRNCILRLSKGSVGGVTIMSADPDPSDSRSQTRS